MTLTSAQYQEIIAALVLNMTPPFPATQTGVALNDSQVIVPDTTYNQNIGANNLTVTYDGVNYYLAMQGYY